MFLVSNLSGISRIEESLNERHVILLLFVKPSDEFANTIIPKFNYYHHLSNRYCSIYAAGFGQDPYTEQYSDKISLPGVNNETWWYSDQCFLEMVDELEQRLPTWHDTGEPQLVMLQSNPGGKDVLNFQNYAALDLAHGLRKKYFDSIPRLLTSLVKSSRKEVTALEVLKDTNRRVRLRKVLEAGLDSSKMVPAPVQKLLKDELFYHTSISKKMRLF